MHTHIISDRPGAYLCFLPFSPLILSLCNSLPVLHYPFPFCSTISRQKNLSLHAVKCNAHVEKKRGGGGALFITSNHATISMVLCFTAAAIVLIHVF